jgi:SAM-dependent MidA family methyltransferase
MISGGFLFHAKGLGFPCRKHTRSRMNPKPELPAPDDTSARHSRAVAAHIAGLIDESGGSIPLYAPGLGYYSAGATKLGAGGDFVTAPEVSPLFGRVLARQSAGVLEQTGGDILEFGAGSGALAVPAIRKLRDLDTLPGRYLILEVSADLRERQSDRITRELPWFADRIEWVDGMPSGFRGVVIANEVADAMPVERFRIDNDEIQRASVRSSSHGFEWCFVEAPPQLADAVRKIESSLGMPLPHGYVSEVSLAVDKWMRELCASVDAGAIFIIDYGLPRREYYAPGRGSGWLRCHFRHRAHDDPLVLPGIQDVTAWVDFTTVAEAAVESGARVAGFMAQAHFLMLGGLEDELADFSDLPVEAQVALSGQVKRLTLPAEMGENFKCIGLTRGAIDAPPVFAASGRTHIL